MKKTITAIVTVAILSGCTTGEDASTNVTIDNDNTQNNQTVENNVTTINEPIISAPTYDIDMWDYLLATNKVKWYDAYSIDANNDIEATYLNYNKVVETKSGLNGTMTLTDKEPSSFTANDTNIMFAGGSYPRFMNFGDKLDNDCTVVNINDSYDLIGYNYKDALMVLCTYDDNSVVKAYQIDTGLVSMYKTSDDGTKMVLNANEN
ncbi:MAG: membrane lipoprotein lipid attachment site-containing protein [Campylobacterota bacterium]|nr:membrane lipoprotein lipid attachment site-containing protein [Campylobacterota bacterium]